MPRNGTGAIVISPTRELALQVWAHGVCCIAELLDEVHTHMTTHLRTHTL